MLSDTQMIHWPRQDENGLISIIEHFCHEERKASMAKVEKESREGASRILKKAVILTFNIIVKSSPEDEMHLCLRAL